MTVPLEPPAPSAPRPARTPGTRSVVVVGGGIAGLSAAWALASSSPAPAVTLLEADTRLGGKLRSAPLGGRMVDLGPDAFLARRPEAVGLCDELGLGPALVAPGSRQAYVWARGGLRPLPDGLALGVPTRLGPLARSGIVSLPGLARAALDLLGLAAREPEGEDPPVAGVTRRHLGREVTARLVDPLVGGIHAGDTARMSTEAVFPDLAAAARHGGSLMRALRAVSPLPPAPDAGPEGEVAAAAAPVFLAAPGGMAQLVDTLAAALRRRGVGLRTGCAVTRLARAGPVPDTPGAPPAWSAHHVGGVVHADAVVLALPAPAAATLLAPLDEAAATLLAAIEHADVAVVTLRMAAGGVRRPLDGTGFLVPRGDGALVTACTWLSSKWPHLARPGDVLLRASAGRHGDDRPAAMDDDELVARVVAELDPVLGLAAAPLEAVVTRWPGAFPQYAPGHLARLEALERAVARLPALALAGAAYRGVGIPACIGAGRRAAAAVLGALAGGQEPPR